MSDPRNFLITSEFPTDKIVWIKEGTVTTNQWGEFSVTIPHGLAGTPFCTGIWSDNNWANQYNASTRYQTQSSYSKFSDISSNASSVVFSGYITATTATTIRYRLWGFFNEQDTLGVVADPTNYASSNIFIKNSNQGYSKLYMEGYADATSTDKTVRHDLGFVPFVDIWYQSAGSWYQLSRADMSQSTTTIQVTDTTLKFVASTTKLKYYYRIYADE